MTEVIKDEASYNPPPTESAWLKFPEGTTTIRLLSHSIHFQNHYLRGENKTFDCTGDVSTCPWCQKGNRKRERWAYIVLVRDEKAPAVKVCEVGFSIFGTILELSKDADYGDPRTYDLKIVRKGTDKDTEYNVIPGKDKALTEKELALLKVEKADTTDKATDKLVNFYKKDETKTEEQDIDDIIESMEGGENE
jgi:hypothetical protein